MAPSFLTVPSMEFKDSFCTYVMAYKKLKDDHYYKKYSPALEDFEKYLNELQALSKDKVSTYWLIHRKKVVGVVRIRHREDPAGGHIDYDISPEFRRRGYGNRILALAIEKAHHLGIRNIIVTCTTSNTASAKIIENNGGKYLDTIYNEDDKKQLLKYLIV